MARASVAKFCPTSSELSSTFLRIAAKACSAGDAGADNGPPAGFATFLRATYTCGAITAFSTPNAPQTEQVIMPAFNSFSKATAD